MTKASTLNAWATILDLLSRRDRSEAQLRQRLEAKGFDRTEITQALERARHYGYLDDRRLARHRAQALSNQGRAVGRRLHMELVRAGIDETIVEQTLLETEQAVDTVGVLRQLLGRRYPNFCYQTADTRSKKRVFDYCLRRGFSRDQIFEALRDPDDA